MEGPVSCKPAGPVTPWPQPVPVRLKPEGPDRLFVMTLGEVRTSLADGTFDPAADRVTMNDGTVIEDYYKKRLDVPFYEPIDKSAFPLPPSGWCSWYYYYQEVTPEEVLANARWIAKHLAEYGCQYVQLDDGWQGTGHGGGENRDWTAIDTRFRELGMERLAGEIRELGLEAGIWLIPHGQSNERLARGARAFLRKADGTTASDTWVGTYLVDPSVPEAHEYLRELLQTLRRWGYTYFKIDGQPMVLDEYEKKAESMAGPASDEPSAQQRAARLYRDTLRTIREAIGPESYLLGCFGIPLPGVGIMHGSRTALDVVQGWDGFLTAADAVQQWNFLHNVAWYCDPDVFYVRPPLSDGMARAWATLQGLTGQGLLTSDRLPDLPPSRVEMLKRVYPAVDIRPLDLFRPERARKPIWLLKVAHLGRAYDVVGVFNYDTETAETHHLSWKELGLEPDQPYHVYDFWQQTYLGAWEQGVFLDVPPADVRVVTLVPANDRPAVVSTSRHITQGWVDLFRLESSGTEERPILSGISQVIADDAYTLMIGLPRGAATFRLVSAQAEPLARGANATAIVQVEQQSHQGYATITIRSKVSQIVAWELRFEPAERYVAHAVAPERLQVEGHGSTDAVVTWPTPYSPNAGYQVAVNGQSVGVAFAPRAVLHDLVPGQSYEISVRALWYDGSTGTGVAETTYIPQAVPK